VGSRLADCDAHSDGVALLEAGIVPGGKPQSRVRQRQPRPGARGRPTNFARRISRGLVGRRPQTPSKALSVLPGDFLGNAWLFPSSAHGVQLSPNQIFVIRNAGVACSSHAGGTIKSHAPMAREI
jgi:hypothetical protein